MTAATSASASCGPNGGITAEYATPAIVLPWSPSRIVLRCSDGSLAFTVALPARGGEYAWQALTRELVARRAVVAEDLSAPRLPSRLGGRGARGTRRGRGRWNRRRSHRARRGGRERFRMAAILRRHIPHRPGHHDEREDPRPRRDGRGRLDTSGLEDVPRTALVGIHQDRNAAADDLLFAQPNHRDPGPVADDERNLLIPRWSFAAGCADAQHMRSVPQIARIELELTGRLEGGSGSALVVDEDVDPHLGFSPSSRMRHLMWSVEVSPGYSV